MTLIHNQTKTPVKPGDTVTDFRGDKSTVIEGSTPPRHSGSTGRIRVDQGTMGMEYYPSVFDCSWID